MNRYALFFIAGLFSTAVVSQAALQVKVTSGEINIVKGSNLEHKAIVDSSIIESGDSLVLTTDVQASIDFDKNTKILFKGPSSVAFTGDSTNFKIKFDEGQVFINRELLSNSNKIEIESKGYSFSPVGTAVAIRNSKTSHPTAAVLKGKIKMQSPTGESIIIEVGNYGSVDPNGNLTSGKLTQKAIESLQDWSGVQLDSISPAQAALDTTSKSIVGSVTPSATAVPVAAPVAQSTDTTKKVEAPLSSPVPAQVSPVASQNVTPQKALPADTISSEKQKSDSKEKAKETAPANGLATAQEKPTFEINAGTVTVDNNQWTRIALGVDVPIWKFGIFFDLEMFVDNDGKISNKGWNFKDDWYNALTRKIRYIRFGHEQDPLFIKLGGLQDVTMGYGFIVDRFTNMLHYPDQKLLGLQVNVNDVSSIGITLQTLVADFNDFRNDGGVVAARLAFTPLKSTGIPILKGISFGGTYAVDINQYAPARDWDINVPSTVRQYRYLRDLGVKSQEAVDSIVGWGYNNPQKDSAEYARELAASEATDQFGIIGGDVGVPLLRSSLVNLDLYGQVGMRDDMKHGWGIGAPGLSLKVWKVWAGVEYRHVEGKFTPGYFGTYYLDERLQREPAIATKEDLLEDNNLNGIFGRLGFNLANVLIIDGSYQYMIGDADTVKDQRFEISSSIGDLIVKRIPKLSKAEVYFQKSRIGSEVVKNNPATNAKEYDAFFDKTPFMYWGYRVGIEMAKGATLIFDSRYGFKRGGDGYKMEPDNNISIQTAISF